MNTYKFELEYVDYDENNVRMYSYRLVRPTNTQRYGIYWIDSHIPVVLHGCNDLPMLDDGRMPGLYAQALLLKNKGYAAQIAVIIAFTNQLIGV